MKGALISPAEPPLIKALGRVSSVPEKLGADILFPALKICIQRKEFKDFVSSLLGDRLAKEVLQMRKLQHRVLIIEGRPSWTSDGEWLNGFQRFTIDQYWGILLSLQTQGVMVLHTRDMRETIRCVNEVVRWVSKKDHTSLSTRPKYLMSKWGTRDDEEFAAWLIQGFDGIGVTTAKAIVKEFGGAPLRWTVTEEELQKVKGVGKERARKMMKALGSDG